MSKLCGQELCHVTLRQMIEREIKKKGRFLFSVNSSSLMRDDLDVKTLWSRTVSYCHVTLGQMIEREINEKADFSSCPVFVHFSSSTD